MEKYKVENGCDIFSWCPDIDKERSDEESLKNGFSTAIEQMEAIARLPYVKYCAMMPDSHTGMDMPIGGVVACDNVVVPNFVGVDIGCGMGAIRTSLNREDIIDVSLRERILHSMSRGIPVGFSHNTDKRMNELEKKYSDQFSKNIDPLLHDHAGMASGPMGDERATKKSFFEQLGTLGGGNHFIEIQYDTDDNVWVMIHSGSRNMGKKVGEHYNKLAQEMNSKWFSMASSIPFLPVDTVEGQEYLKWMNFDLNFAYLNRLVMLEEVKKTLINIFPTVEFTTDKVVDDTENNIINIHHNFAAVESHFGKNYWIHRKGATRAFNGVTGIIPSSMGTPSHIVKGKGCKVSMMSCSHGTGRKMGRKEFNVKMKGSYDEIEESLDGIVHSEFSTSERGRDKGLKDVSECPLAYKDIDWVMGNQMDLVESIVELHPLVSMKG